MTPKYCDTKASVLDTPTYPHVMHGERMSSRRTDWRPEPKNPSKNFTGQKADSRHAVVEDTMGD